MILYFKNEAVAEYTAWHGKVWCISCSGDGMARWCADRLRFVRRGLTISRAGHPPVLYSSGACHGHGHASQRGPIGVAHVYDSDCRTVERNAGTDDADRDGVQLHAANVNGSKKKTGYTFANFHSLSTGSSNTAKGAKVQSRHTNKTKMRLKMVRNY